MSLIELAVVVGLIVALAAIILLTVANRASNVRLESYANQVAGSVQIAQQMKDSGIRTAKISQSEFEISLKTLLAGSQDFTTASFASGNTAPLSDADTDTAGGCGTTATANPGVALVTAGDLDAEDTAQLAAFIATATAKVVTQAEFGDLFENATGAIGGGFRVIRATNQNIVLCF